MHHAEQLLSANAGISYVALAFSCNELPFYLLDLAIAFSHLAWVRAVSSGSK